MQRGISPASNPLSIHVTFTAIVPGAYPGEAKMCLRLSWGSQIVVTISIYAADAPSVAIAKFLFYTVVPVETGMNG